MYEHLWASVQNLAISFHFLIFILATPQKINWNLQGILKISEHLYFDTWEPNTDVQETNVVYLRIFYMSAWRDRFSATKPDLLTAAAMASYKCLITNRGGEASKKTKTGLSGLDPSIHNSLDQRLRQRWRGVHMQFWRHDPTAAPRLRYSSVFRISNTTFITHPRQTTRETDQRTSLCLSYKAKPFIQYP